METVISGNDGFSGTKTPDDAILFTVSGITVLVEFFFVEMFHVDLSKISILKLIKIQKVLLLYFQK